MKRKATIIATLGIFIALPLAAIAASPIRGDANGDGIVNVVDLVAVERTVAGIDSVERWVAFGLDANGDGNYNVIDITATEIIISTFDYGAPHGN